jgi:hypothetical protein
MKIYLFITSSLGLFIALFILWLIRKDHLHVKYAFGWIFIGILSAIIGFFPSIVDYIAYKAGISYPPILAVIIAFAFLIIKVLLMDIERSRQERNFLRLTQRLGMLEAELQETQGKKEQSQLCDHGRSDRTQDTP